MVLYSNEQLVELLGCKASEVVKVLGLATEFFYAKHSGSFLLSTQLRKGFNRWRGACEAVPRGKVKPRSAPERGRASLVVGHENPLTLQAPCHLASHLGAIYSFAPPARTSS